MTEDIRKMTSEELQTRLKEKRTDLFKLKQKAVTEKVEKSHEFRQMRADIARVLTEMNARRHKANPRKSEAPKAAAPKAKAVPAPRKTPRVARKKSATAKA